MSISGNIKQDEPVIFINIEEEPSSTCKKKTAVSIDVDSKYCSEEQYET